MLRNLHIMDSFIDLSILGYNYANLSPGVISGTTKQLTNHQTGEGLLALFVDGCLFWSAFQANQAIVAAILHYDPLSQTKTYDGIHRLAIVIAS